MIVSKYKDSFFNPRIKISISLFIPESQYIIHNQYYRQQTTDTGCEHIAQPLRNAIFYLYLIKNKDKEKQDYHDVQHPGKKNCVATFCWVMRTGKCTKRIGR